MTPSTVTSSNSSQASQPTGTSKGAEKAQALINSINAENGFNKTEATKDAEKINGDYSDFLLLLTAQMKNQDPLKPLDSTTFVSQLAQFSNVEQQVKMNAKLDGLVSNLSQDSFSEASGYLGKSVMVDGGKIQLSSNDKQTSFYYKTSENIKQVHATITDRFGKVVNELSLPVAPNGRTQNWDLTDQDKERVENGLYKISLKMMDAEGNTTQYTPKTKNKISEAQKTDSGFEYITNTGQRLKQQDISLLLAE